MFWTVFVTFAVAVLSGLGVGSAGLLVIWLTMAEQLPQLTAQGLNLVFFLFSSGAALTVHLSRTELLFGAILLMIPGGIAGSLFGTFLAGILPEQILRKLFGLLLIVSGASGLFVKRKKSAPVRKHTEISE